MLTHTEWPYTHRTGSISSREQTQQKSSGVHYSYRLPGHGPGMGSLQPTSVSFMILLGRDEGEELVLGLVLVLGRRRRRLDGAGGGEAVLPELLAHELVVDEGGAPEVGEHEPRDEQQLELVPDGDPVYEGLEEHLHERDEGVEDPVGEPLLVVQLGRALHRPHGRVQRVQQHHRWPCKGVEVSEDRPQLAHPISQLGVGGGLVVVSLAALTGSC